MTDDLQRAERLAAYHEATLVLLGECTAPTGPTRAAIRAVKVAWDSYLACLYPGPLYLLNGRPILEGIDVWLQTHGGEEGFSRSSVMALRPGDELQHGNYEAGPVRILRRAQ